MFEKEYKKLMRRCIALAKKSEGHTSPNPLVGAVIFDDDTVIEGINDSKKLSEKKREKLYDEIISKAKAYCIATASVKEIEELNILNAAMLAMKRAYEGLGLETDLALIDGNKTPNLTCKSVAVVKGDATSQSIAAASILAKVARDRYIIEISDKYPEYNFKKHKGYGTKEHREALLKYGPCEIHRKTFLTKILGG